MPRLVSKDWILPSFRPKTMARRGRVMIIFDILKVASNIEVRTNIFGSANLSYQKLQEILEQLIEQGLVTVKKRGSRTSVKLTEKGFRAIEAGTKFLTLIDRLNG